MGLDQYLYATRHVSSTNHNDFSPATNYNQLLDLVGATAFAEPDFGSACIQVKVAYWRKANAIHGWFVANVQDGEDNCAEYYLTHETLEELRDLCKQVMDNHELAEELLPPEAGFFFGSDEVDEYYFQNLQYTHDTLTKLLDTVPDDWAFVYSSSW